jgi:hypothetical protein
MSPKKIILAIFILLAILSVTSIYYKYIVLGDFEYVTADLSEFPE